MDIKVCRLNKAGDVDVFLADGHRAFTITSSGGLRINPQTFQRPEFIEVRNRVLKMSGFGNG